MSFRKFGGLQYAAKHNIVSSNYNTSNNLLVTEKVGQQPNSNINFESDIYLDGNLHILPLESTYLPSNNGIYFPDGTFQNTASSSSGEGINGIIDVSNNGLEYGAQITTTRYLQLGAATTEYPGVVTTGEQTLAGSKSFSVDISVHGLRLGLGGQSSGTANPYNTAFGYYALSKTSSSSSVANNVAIGYQSMKKTTTGSDNVAIGANSLVTNMTGSNNVAIGSGALALNQDSSNNTAIGYNALYNNTSGYWNLAIGTNSLYNIQTSSNSIAIGYKALYWSTIGGNLAVGNNALYSNSSGYYNLGIGSGALFCTTTGIQNAGIGLGSLYNNATGSNNVAFGLNSLYYNETGSKNVAIGCYAGPTGANKAALSNSIAIGYNANTSASNTIQMGNSDIIQMNTSGTIGVGNYSSDSDASGIAGSIYYNTASSVLKVYDGSNWNTIGSGGSGVTGPTGTIAGVTSLSSSGLAYGATTISNGYLQFAYSMGGGTGNTPGLQPGSYSDIFSTQTIDLGAAYPNGNFGANWSAILGPSDWAAVSISSSGQYQTAVVDGGYIYISSDYGNTWTPVMNDANRNWLSVSISSSGQYQTAVMWISGYIYISSDYGNSWTPVMNDAPRTWFSVSISSSGQYQTAVANDDYNGDYIYISSDYGNTWTSATDAGSNIWRSVSISSSGQYQTAAASYEVYISSDFGKTWSYISSITASAVSVSSSGQYQTAVYTGYYIYVSSNYGNDWTLVMNDVTRNWQSVSISSSGQYQVASIYNDGYVYVSSDYGKNWSEIASGPYGAYSTSISSSGQYITCGVPGGYIYTCYNSPSTKGVLYVGNYSSTSGVTGVTGSMYYDTTDNAMKYSDGTQWNTFGSGSGVTGPTGAAGSSGSGLAGVTGIYTDGLENGAQITSENYLQLGAATENYPGVVTIGAQTFAGAKSFTSDISVNSLTIGLGNNSVSTNTVIGKNALNNNVSGTSCVAIGLNALLNNTSGKESIAIGSGALSSITTLGGSIGIGNDAARYNTGGNNIAIGRETLYGTSDSSTGEGNIAIGYRSLYSLTTGTNNVAVGLESLHTNTTGYNNTAIGYYAGSYGRTPNTTGYNNTFIGFAARANSSSISTSTAIGYDSVVSSSNQIALGTASENVTFEGGYKFQIVTSDVSYNCSSTDYGKLIELNNNANAVYLPSAAISPYGATITIYANNSLEYILIISDSGGSIYWKNKSFNIYSVNNGSIITFASNGSDWIVTNSNFTSLSGSNTSSDTITMYSPCVVYLTSTNIDYVILPPYVTNGDIVTIRKTYSTSYSVTIVSVEDNIYNSDNSVASTSYIMSGSVYTLTLFARGNGKWYVE